MLTWWLRRIWFGKKSCIVTTIFLSNSYWQLFPIYMRLVGSLSMFLFLDADLWAIDNAARPGTLVLPKLLIGSAVGASPGSAYHNRSRNQLISWQHRLHRCLSVCLSFLRPKSVIISYSLVWWVTQIYSNNLNPEMECWDGTQIT